MELTPGQQRLLFAVIVVALAGLGIYLISARPGATAAPAASPSAATGPAAGTAGTAAPAAVPPATVPPPAPIPTVAGGADIYQWVPFTQADLTAAARTTLSFAGAYVTWSYQESKTAYAAKLAPLATPQEVATLEYDYSTAGVAGTRAADKQVSAGSASITSISSFGAGPSITFQVSIVQRLAATTGTTTSASQYAVTVVSGGSGWRVHDIELSTLGNS